MRILLLIICILFSVQSFAQTLSFCEPASVISSKLQVKFKNIYIIDSIFKFKINDYKSFEDRFKKFINPRKIKNALSSNNYDKEKDSFSEECLTKFNFSNFESVDSISKLNQQKMNNPKYFTMDMKEKLEKIAFLGDRELIIKKRDSLLKTADFIAYQNYIDTSIAWYIFFQTPIFIDNKYAFVNLYLHKTNRDAAFFTFLLRKEHTKWVVVKQEIW
jgi:hypothetical protein